MSKTMAGKATPTPRTELVDQISQFLATNYPCDCGAGSGCSEEPEAEAIVEMMEAAGFGLVADAKAEAFDYGWREGAGWPTPINVDTGETLHGEAKQAPWNPYRAAS